jgi:hypothetical protein
MQEDPITHEKCIIGWASRQLMKHECNCSAFLLKLQAAIYRIEYWSTHLWGNPFMLYTDHRPMEKLGMVHTKPLNRLQEKIRDYHFEICYIKGRRTWWPTTGPAWQASAALRLRWHWLTGGPSNWQSLRPRHGF